MPLQATSGAASYDAFGGGVPVEPNYIESVFSCFLYTGNGSTQTITNGIDLSTKGGLVWIKARTLNADHLLYDTSRGVNKVLYSNSTVAQDTTTASLTAFNNNGFSVNATGGYTNSNTYPYVSWTFRKQPKFFDVVTYTGNGTAGRTISHNLGSVPGCIFVKQTNVSGENWDVYHRSLANNKQLYLNTTNAELTTSSWNSTTPTSTVFTVGDGSSINANGSTYVAYLFAHDAGGFGLTGTDNVISCGTYTTDGSGNATVNLGYEPQWVLTKATSGTYGTTSWVIADNMRGMPAPPETAKVAGLFPNLSDAEDNNYNRSVHPTSTGFVANQYVSTPYIYIAIRRGPMKVPTSGTSVFAPILNTGTASAKTISGIGFAPDLLWDGIRNTAGYGNYLLDKLRGGSQRLGGASTAAEVTESPAPVTQFGNTSVNISASGTVNDSGVTYVNWFFQRAPSFFDEVCYTGTGSNTTVAHNLTVVPELLMVKRRDATASWHVGSTLFPNYGDELSLNSTASIAAGNVWQNTPNTATYFTLRTNTDVNASGGTYVAYLFATCAGVSKVFSYTGNGSSQTINCGFTAGSRWVMIKRTDSAGDWYVWDSARGIVSGNDPHLSLNTTDAEVTTDDTIDTDSTGFVVNQVSATNVNVSSATYIGIAIA